MFDLTSATRTLPNGKKFPATPKPLVVRDCFGLIEVVSDEKSKKNRNR